MKTTSGLRIALAMIAAAGPSAAMSATTIDFEIPNAPNRFDISSPLSDRYAGLGVTFAGADGPGGYIIQAGRLDIDARSGSDLLLFNTSGVTGRRERLTFSSTVTSVSIYLANGYMPATFFITGYDSAGLLLDTSLVDAPTGNQYVRLALDGANFSSVEFGAILSNYFAADDLSFTFGTVSAAAPEPTSWAMMLVGFGMVGYGKRRAGGTLRSIGAA